MEWFKNLQAAEKFLLCFPFGLAIFAGIIWLFMVQPYYASIVTGALVGIAMAVVISIVIYYLGRCPRCLVRMVYYEDISRSVCPQCNHCIVH